MYDMVGGDIFLVKDRQLCRVAPKGRDPSCFRACFSSGEYVNLIRVYDKSFLDGVGDHLHVCICNKKLFDFTQ